VADVHLRLRYARVHGFGKIKVTGARVLGCQVNRAHGVALAKGGKGNMRSACVQAVRRES